MGVRFDPAQDMRLRRIAFERSNERQIPLRQAWREVRVEALRGTLEEKRAAAAADHPKDRPLPWYLEGPMA